MEYSYLPSYSVFQTVLFMDLQPREETRSSIQYQWQTLETVISALWTHTSSPQWTPPPTLVILPPWSWEHSFFNGVKVGRFFLVCEQLKSLKVWVLFQHLTEEGNDINRLLLKPAWYDLRHIRFLSNSPYPFGQEGLGCHPEIPLPPAGAYSWELAFQEWMLCFDSLSLLLENT